MVTVRSPAARSCRSRSSPTTAPRARATSKRTMRSSAFGTALWYRRAGPVGEKFLGGRRKEPGLEGVAVGFEGGTATLREERLLDRKEGVHELGDPNFDLDVGELGRRRNRADQRKDLLQAQLVGGRHPLHTLEVHLLELLEEPINELDGAPDPILTSFHVALVLFRVTDIGVGLGKQSCH